MKVAFYPGCTAHSTGLEYNDSLHAAMGALGVEFEEIDDWNCCGGAAAHSLSKLLGIALPARNIKQAQQGALPLVISCAGCFNAVKTADHYLANDPDMKRQLEDVVGFKYSGQVKILALHEIVTTAIGLPALKQKVVRPLTGLKVASYYGCALVRNPRIMQMGDHENPVFLDDIAAALGAEPVDWSYKVDCCGADIALTHGDIAIELADKIVEGAREAGADCVISACGLCQINLDMRQSGRGGARIPQFYYTELMGVALDVGDRGEWWTKHIVDPVPLLKSRKLY
ncbi:MAG: CoB--CoM heterodisulfide reductase iron-sulfur subunit B family protein [Planctomycetota bacterium]